MLKGNNYLNYITLQSCINSVLSCVTRMGSITSANNIIENGQRFKKLWIQRKRQTKGERKGD